MRVVFQTNALAGGVVADGFGARCSWATRAHLSSGWSRAHPAGLADCTFELAIGHEGWHSLIQTSPGYSLRRSTRNPTDAKLPGAWRANGHQCSRFIVRCTFRDDGRWAAVHAIDSYCKAVTVSKRRRAVSRRVNRTERIYSFNR